jgi:fibronectin-binding autotransporter adhesin
MGASTNYLITLTTNSGFSGPITFAVGGLPANTTAGFVPASLSAAGSSTLTVSAGASATSGIYTLTVFGTNSSGASNIVAIALTIVSPGSNLVWNSTSSTAWDTTTTNWFNQFTGLNDVFQTGKNVIFNDGVNLVTNVTIASSVAMNPGNVSVTSDTANYVISGAGKITGAGGLAKTGNSRLTITTTNDFTGPVTISDGVVSVTSLANGGASSGIGAGTAANTNLVLDGGALQWTGSASTAVNRGMTVTPNNGMLDSSPSLSANLTFSGSIVMSGSGARTLFLTGTDPNPSSLGSNALNSVIADATGGATVLEKDGNNAWVLSGNNSYSGGTLINNGRLRANSSVNAFGSGTVTVAGGAQAYLNLGSTFPNAFSIQGNGVAESSGSLGALTLGADGCTITNMITLDGDARITAFGAVNTGATISGLITGDSSLEFGNSGSSSGASVTNNIAAVADAYVLRSAATTDEDESQVLNTKGLNDSNTRIAYLRFDLTSLLSAYSVSDIQTVTLRLYMTGTSSANQVWVYGLDDSVNGVSDSTWTSAMTWNTQPARTTSPNDIPQSSSALPNTNTTGVLGLTSFTTTVGEVDITLDPTAFKAFLTADSNHQITLLFHNSAGINAGWASISNTSGFLVPTLQVVGSPSGVGGLITLANGGNDWSGDTIISHGTVKLAAANALPHGAGQGDVLINGSSATVNSVLNLNGISTTIDGLNSQGNLARCVISNAIAPATLSVGDNDANGEFDGTIADGGSVLSFTKLGAGTEILGGANTYTGATLVQGGALVVNGSLAGTVTVAAGGALGGNGVVNGTVVVNSGATIAPGNSIGILTAGSGATLGGTAFMELNPALATNDVLRSSGTIQYGGVLVLTNLSGIFTTTNTFTLFNAANYSGAFTNIVPAIPAVGLAWNTNTLTTDGTLRIAAAPTPQPQIFAVSLSSSNIMLSGTNGVANWPYIVLTTTNITLPVANWNIQMTNNFDSNGNFIFTNPVDPAVPEIFYMLQLQ